MNHSPQETGLVIEGGELFAPESFGVASIAAIAGVTTWIGEGATDRLAGLPGLKTIDARGMRIIPGLIDQHIHFLGGGDANGPLGRVPELTPDMLLSTGTTTAVGVLGVDNETRDLRLLLRKAHELRNSGVSAYLYSGGMPLPARHLMGSVCADVSFIDQVIGAKSAVAERLHPNRSWHDLAELAGELMRARALSGKAAVLHCHVGSLPEAIEPLMRLVTELGMPPDQIVPTHVNRTPDFSPVFGQAIAFAKNGGTIDMTCCVSRIDGNLAGVDVPEAVKHCLEEGVPLGNITISTDGNIPATVRDIKGRALGYRVVPPSVLFRDVMRLVHESGLALEKALTLATTNVARVLGLAGRKGQIALGHDADYVLLGPDDSIQMVIARGRIVFRRGEQGA
ncbi:amidohydrolase family protein [Microvirga brassicacearum]|uniref:amidohydrolase family protein n=1 Tax=Microvirga brassicacearum TaxID=2580413 RepID=UPI001391B0AB|nr:amidohydrolase family protein [Microvirga brassicacearum]